MGEVKSLLDVLQPGESALAVFTDGRHLRLNDDGSGTSGNWKAAPGTIDRFVIYHCGMSAGVGARIYSAKITGISPSPEAGRIVVSFECAVEVGVTRVSWPEFADTGMNPVRYIVKPQGD